MKVLLNVLVEQGDTIPSIVEAMHGAVANPQVIWEFNRNVMPSPMQLPQPGTIIRIPVDPRARSGAPSLSTLRAAHISDEALARASTVLGEGGPDDPPETVEGSAHDLAHAASAGAGAVSGGDLTTDAPPATTSRQKP